MSKTEKKDSNELGIEGVPYSGRSLANKFDDHFLAAGAPNPNVRNKSDFKGFMKSAFKDSIFLVPTTPDETCALILQLKNNKSSGIDDLSVKPIKSVAHIIDGSLSHICNLILSTGIFPDDLKIVKVSVIFKGGNENDLSNYRPISVLPIFLKIIEQVINIRLLNFCKQKGIIAKQQYGFQKEKSTEQALLNIKDKIIRNFERKCYTIGIFLDFKKAFDSVKHNILLQKDTSMESEELLID